MSSKKNLIAIKRFSKISSDPLSTEKLLRAPKWTLRPRTNIFEGSKRTFKAWERLCQLLMSPQSSEKNLWGSRKFLELLKILNILEKIFKALKKKDSERILY